MSAVLAFWTLGLVGWASWPLARLSVQGLGIDERKDLTMAARYLGKQRNLLLMQCSGCRTQFQATEMGLHTGQWRTCPKCKKPFATDDAIQEMIDAGGFTPAKAPARYDGRHGRFHRIVCGHCGERHDVTDQTIAAGGYRFCPNETCMRPLVTARLMESIRAGDVESVWTYV